MLRVCLLGRFEIEWSGQADEPRPSIPVKAQALLAYLAAEPGAWQSRERLADLLWPTLIPAAGRNNLRQVLLSLHRLLADQSGDSPCLQTDRHSVRLAPDCFHQIDLPDFVANHRDVTSPAPDRVAEAEAHHIESLSRRLALYRGELLAGIDLEQCEDYGSWLQIQREALRRQAVAIAERLMQLLSHQGHYEKALQVAQRLVDLDPLCEEGYRACMRLLALTEQPAAALAQYQACCQVLDDELGVMPDSSTRKLAEEIAKGRHHQVLPTAPVEHPNDRCECVVAERRQVTALYCQLVCPVEEDPEALLDLLHQQQRRCMEILQARCGHVVRTNDGGVLAYFGYPQALEQAAIQAVRAGLELVDRPSAGFSRRVGIHTGLMVTGTDPNLPDTIGRTSRFAVHLCQHGEPYRVLVSAATRRLAMGYFQWASLAALSLPDESTSCEIFQAVAPTYASSRVGATGALAPFVGREQELALLATCWEAAVVGKGQALLLMGEAGIGKSRLVHAFRQGIRDSLHHELELTCLPEFTPVPFHPLKCYLERHRECPSAGAIRDRSDQLAERLQRLWPSVPVDNILKAFACLLQQPRDAGEAQAETDAGFSQQRQQRLVIDSFAELLLKLARARPLLLVVEDVHWSDPSTLEMLAQVLSQLQGQRILVVLMARPGLTFPWSADAVAWLALEPLASAEITALVTSLIQGLPARTRGWIIDRANGNPLFAEELARMYQEHDQLEPDAIPTTVRDLLAARLDRIPDAKDIVQLAAVLGRQFEIDQLERICAHPGEVVIRGVQRLRDEGILVGSLEQGFAFRHALYQEAAYQSLVNAERHRAHRRIAELLSEEGAASTPPAILAQHWEAAKHPVAAMRTWIQAGELANRQGAHREAIRHFQMALALKERVPEEGDHQAFEYRAWVGLGMAHARLQGPGAAEAIAAFKAAVALAQRDPDRLDAHPALSGLWYGISSQSDYVEMLRVAERLFALAEAAQDAVRLQQAHYALGHARFWRGQLQPARHHFESALALYRPEHLDAMLNEYGESVAVTSTAFLAWVLCVQGYPEQAQGAMARSRVLARKSGHPYTMGFALLFEMVLARMLRNPTATLKLADEGVEFATRYGYQFGLTGSLLMRGWALTRLGKSEGIAVMRDCVDSVPVMMNGSTVIFVETLAEALTHLGRFEEAHETLQLGLLLIDELDDRVSEAELHRLDGECRLALSPADPNAAASAFERALTLARKQGARLYELRAATALARLWVAVNRKCEARQLLDDVLGGFSEGLEHPDLQQAQALLASF